MAASREHAFPKIDIPLDIGSSTASNRKYPPNPKCSAPAFRIVSRESVAIWTLRPFPIRSLARISSNMARSSSIARRSAPRMSANELALFMVSSDTARIGIIRRSKVPPTAPIIRYRDVRAPICSFLSDANRRVNPLQTAEELFRQRADDAAESSLRQDDARQCIEVIQAVRRMAKKLARIMQRAGGSGGCSGYLVGLDAPVPLRL